MSLAFVSKARVVATGRVFFAVGMIGIGCQEFFFSQFVPLVAPIWPKAIPGRLFWVYLAGTILVVCGASILSGVKARTSATVLGGLFLLSLILLHIPANLIARVTSWIGWAGAFEAFSIAGCALVVAGTLLRTEGGSSPRTWMRWLDRIIPFGMYPFAILVIVYGISHFIYVSLVSSLVPAWIPGHIFWTYFAGTALIASGLGMIFRVQARLAATLLGAMILTWVVVLHIPRAVADPYSGVGGEWSSVFVALAESGVAFILGETILPKRSSAVTAARNSVLKKAPVSD
jgi:uncharacterized membrane protein YphA (DoxX/SURF4 family)